ncbi:hypothetical protein [Bacillus wiedmannii]|uniref:hypothetical protein n=1 Tax=Bacillus wiedmannii TaxID=1890302 RepID=UPI000BF6F334|nr:hypothetical protein [Bacillus wiedmannii]PFZ94579.1 hypothetical protein COL78_20935 [Bacillus wiedmannii]
MNTNISKKNNLIKMFFALTFAFLCFAPTDTLAAEIKGTTIKETTKQESTTSGPSYVAVETYVTVEKYFSKREYALPPAKYYHSEIRDGMIYSGYLTRHSYASTGDTWIVVYKGFIKA